MRIRSSFFLQSPLFSIWTLFKILQDKGPYYLTEIFERPATTERPTRQLTPKVFAVPSFRTSTYHSFYVTAIYFSNSFPWSVVSEPTLSVFRDRLHAHLFVLEGKASQRRESLWRAEPELELQLQFILYFVLYFVLLLLFIFLPELFAMLMANRRQFFEILIFLQIVKL